jgi:hypothetical protein
MDEKLRLVENPDEFEAPDRKDNVIQLSITTNLNLDPDVVLREAIGKLDSVVIIGYTKGDNQNRSANDEYFASSIAAGDTVTWLLHRYIHKLVKYADQAWENRDDDEDSA